MDVVKRLNHIKCSPEDLEELTNNFSEENLIGETQFGKVYRGKTQQGQNVTVKIMEDVGRFPVGRDYLLSQLKNETIFLMEPIMYYNPNLANLIGYCCEDSLLGAVYDLQPMDTVRNLIEKDGFSWLQRIKVAIGIARLLEFLHHRRTPHYLVRNISAAHIMLEQDCNPVLFDFGMLVGGVLGEKQPIPHQFVLGAPGCTDPVIINFCRWGTFEDTFAFGCVLLELICKRTSTIYDPVWFWATNNYLVEKPKKSLFCFSHSHSKEFSLVHKSFEEDLGFSHKDGYKITELALNCVDNFVRPSMKEVVQRLESLQAVRCHGNGGLPI